MGLRIAIENSIAAGGGVVPGAAGSWFADGSVSDLSGAFDMRDIDGASSLTTDVNDGLTLATDLSGNGNDWDGFRADGNAKIARIGIGGSGDRSCRCVAGARQIESRAVLCGWPESVGKHWFFVVNLPSIAKNSADSSTSLLAIALYSGLSTSDGPLLRFDEAGGAVASPDWEMDAGSPVLTGASAGGSYCNLASLTGRPDTDAATRLALVEFRQSTGGSGLVQVWVNGFKIGEVASVPGVDDGYIALGSPSVNSTPQVDIDFVAWAVGETDVAFTESKAADVRAAMLADFGIDTWDGATYPS